MRLLLVLAALLVSGTVDAQGGKGLGGYGKSKWGMSPAQVLSAEGPRAQEVPDDGDEKKDVFATIPEIELVGQKFKADFRFARPAKKLTGVTLKAHEQGNALINSRGFTHLEAALTEKYGKPASRAIPEVQNGNGDHKVTWVLPSTRITLWHLQVMGQVSYLTVTYEPAKPAKGSDDL